MKIAKLLIVSSFALIATSAFARPGVFEQPTAPDAPLAVSFVFDLPNTLTPTSGITMGPTGDFTFDIRLNYAATPPPNAASLSYWFEVPTAFAPFITITIQHTTNNANGNTAFPILAQQDPYPLPFSGNSVPGQHDPGFEPDHGFSSNGDLGGGTLTGNGFVPGPNSFYVSTLTFHLANAPLGTWSLQTTTALQSSVS